MKNIEYCLSANNPLDGKSVCLWRGDEHGFAKIARFQSDEAAKLFAKEFNFPFSQRLKERLESL
jgi:hypothetical protein